MTESQSQTVVFHTNTISVFPITNFTKIFSNHRLDGMYYIRIKPKLLDDNKGINKNVTRRED